ncbi:MAG: VWA domain-containing protein, partial [Verrucomicrobiota bacterium]
RDLLLLVLRTLAVIFFVLAMARPFFAADKGKTYSGGPVHAIMVVDNSLSMAYKPIDQTLLDMAKARAGEFIKSLPNGSRISIIPLCERETSHSRSAYSSSEDALEALNRIEVSDRSGSAGEAAEKARRASRSVADVQTKRVVLVGDMQRVNWAESQLAESFEGLDNIQVVSIGPEQRNNAWISRFELVDGIADIESPAVFVAGIRYEGEAARTGQRVILKVDGEVAADRNLDLTPGQHLELVFQHRFDVAGTSSEPLFVPVTVELSGDELDADNFRSLVVPVIARMPVVFVDQYGQRESTRMNRYGETYPLRQLLASRVSRSSSERNLIDVRHLTIEQVGKDTLQDARLVALAGIQAP